MPGTKTEKDFDFNDYDHFYEDEMHFVELSEEQSLEAHRHIPRFGWAYDIVRELKPRSVLDLGCLEGSFILSVAKNLGIAVAGVEMNKDAVALAQKRAKENNIPAKFLQAAAEDYLENTTLKFDVITCFEVLEHVKDPARLLKLIDKALAPGGTVLISTPAFESPTYGKNDVLNKCHVRLYTTRDEDYEEMTDHQIPGEPQKLRKATSIYKEIGYGDAKRGHERTIECGVYSELLNIRYV